MIIMRSTKLPTTLALDRGATMPLFGRTQYFFGLVVLTYSRNVAQVQALRYYFVLHSFFCPKIHRKDSFTLNATCLSVLFVSCSVQEICLFNSTAEQNREKNQGTYRTTAGYLKMTETREKTSK
jgi:hypothetical protein